MCARLPLNLMAKNNIIAGLDVGSSRIRVVIAEDVPDADVPRVIGTGIAPSTDIRRGTIIDADEVARAINETVKTSERVAGIVVKRAVVNIGGAEIGFQNSKGVIAVGRADKEVTEEDVNRVIAEAQNTNLPPNKEIIHIIPKNYRLDDQENIKDPVGMKGVRLEVDALVVEGLSTHIKNIAKAAEGAGIEVDDLVLEPLAAARAVLNRKQKELGVALVNIGGGTTSLSVFEEGDLLHASVLPVGAGHITNDIAIGLRTSIETAEKIKLEYGTALAKEISKKEDIDLSIISSREIGFVSRHHVAEIIEARLEEIFTLINKELKKIGRANLLPAGAVITGGGSKMPQISELAKNILGLPAQVGFPVPLGGMTDRVDDPEFATAVGLVLWEKDQRMIARGNSRRTKMIVDFSRETRDSVRKIRGWFEKFLP